MGGIHDAPWDPDQIQLQPIKACPESDTLSVVEFSSDTSKRTNDPGPARLYMKAVLAKGKTDENKAKQKETTKNLFAFRTTEVQVFPIPLIPFSVASKRGSPF